MILARSLFGLFKGFANYSPGGLFRLFTAFADADTHRAFDHQNVDLPSAVVGSQTTPEPFVCVREHLLVGLLSLARHTPSLAVILLLIERVFFATSEIDFTLDMGKPEASEYFRRSGFESREMDPRTRTVGAQGKAQLFL